ncbi:uncharacterized protein Fot_02183 [Forsythia ovata]|uniref:Uncharacterized protein n=1 Tax=Forsythia ovata TaxID=205694 RepID=A0ABD1X638_9LAMI
MECIFGNDTATGDRAVSGFDNFSSMPVDESVNELDTPSPTPSRKRRAEEGTIARRKCTKHHDDDSHQSLALIAESSKKICRCYTHASNTGYTESRQLAVDFRKARSNEPRLG